MSEKERKGFEQIESNESSEKSLAVKEAYGQVDQSDAITDLMHGVEGGTEKDVTERKEQKGESGGAGTKTQTQQKRIPKPKHRPLPSPNIMRKRVVQELKTEESDLIKKLPSTAKNAFEYAEKVKQIRTLRQKIYDFLHAGFEAMKQMYLSIFGKLHGYEKEEK